MSVHVHYIERKGRGFYIVTDPGVDPDEIVAELNAGLLERVGPNVMLVDPGDAEAWASAINPCPKWMLRACEETAVAKLLRGVADWCARMLYRR